MAAFMTFITMKNSVNFAFYFFVITRAASKTQSQSYLDHESKGRKFTFQFLVRMLYFNFTSPALICLLFIKELTTEPLKLYLGIDEFYWQVVRLLIIVLMLQPKYMIYREELQF